MGFSDPILIPKSREEQWSEQISEILNKQLDTDLETPSASIFLLPEIITKHKPEAYEAQQIGIGPKFHFRPWPYKKTEQRKLTAVKKVLRECRIKNFEEQVLHKVWALVPAIRACYDMFLQDDDYFLAWIFTIDGLFLLYHIHSYKNGVDYDKERYDLQDKKKESNEHIIAMDVDPIKRLFAQDLTMAENQIPFKVLEEIDNALHPSSENTIDIDSPNNFSPSIFRSFCEIHSPLELCSMSQAPTLVNHLLDYLYHSIVNNVPQKSNGSHRKGPSFRYPIEEPSGSSSSKKEKDPLLPIGKPVIDLPLGKFNSPIFNFVQKIPWEKVLPLYEKTVTTLETFSHSKIDIPPASKLHGAGFKFHLLAKDEGIWKIDTTGKDIYLPCVTLHTDSEVILRNLIAYETMMGNPDNFPLNEYVGLMCGLIRNLNDVKLLQRKKIIQGDLREDEVVKLFVGMSSSIQTIKTRKKSKLHEKIVEVNRVYESRRKMWYMLMRKIAYWLLMVLRAIGIFAGASLKIVAFVISLATVFLLTSQAYCEAYGCSKTKVSLLTYGS